MPLTVTDSGGNVRHLFQLPDASCPEPEVTITYAKQDIPLTDAYRSGVFCGSYAGTKTFNLTFPTVAASTIINTATTLTDIKTGVAVSRELYLRSVFADNRATGEPFVILDRQTNTYHFVDFEEGVTFQRMRVQIYSVGVKLQERRISGITLPSP